MEQNCFIEFVNDRWFWERAKRLCETPALETFKPLGWCAHGEVDLPDGTTWNAGQSGEAVLLVWIYWRAIAGEYGARIKHEDDGTIEIESADCFCSVKPDGNTYFDVRNDAFAHPSPFERAKMLEEALEVLLERIADGKSFEDARLFAEAAYKQEARDRGLWAGEPEPFELWCEFRNDHMTALYLVRETATRERALELARADVERAKKTPSKYPFRHRYFVVAKGEFRNQIVNRTPDLLLCEMCGSEVSNGCRS